MNALNYRLSPVYLFLAVALLGLGMSLVSLLIALSQPHIDLPRGSVPIRVGSIQISAVDLIAEPDQLGSYTAIREFRRRQDDIRAELNEARVQVTYSTPDSASSQSVFEIRARRLSDLPWIYWFQLLVGMISISIGGWVLSLRRNDWGVRLFSLTAFFLVFATHSAAIYSTRQIALGSNLFVVLSNINAFGSMAFGIALVGMFTQYPRSLFQPVWLLIPTFGFGTGIILNNLSLGPDNLIGLIVLSEMLISMLFGAIQWYLSRREPLNRAGLRWFILVSLLGCSLFIFLSSAPITLGISDRGFVTQGVAFAFFNIMHVGLALGIMRYKVFNLDRWSYYIWLWLSGMLMVFAVDVLMIHLLQWQPWFSLGIALMISGFLYFPLRQMLLKFFLHSRAATLKGRMSDIVSAALAPSFQESELRWDALLNNVYAPLAPPEKVTSANKIAMMEENGLALLVPGIDGHDARRLRYALNGRRLFSPDDLDIAANISQTYELAADSRRSYERGVQLERDRISRDVHDNIGAQLLSALHSREVSRKDDLLRDSLSDLRAIINDGFQTEFGLLPLLADLRQETALRLEAHHIHLDWTDLAPDIKTNAPVISFALANGLRSVLRETVSNALRHSEAATVWVKVAQNEKVIRLDIEDDGKGLDEHAVAANGNGIPNVRDRVEALHGNCIIGNRLSGMAGARIQIELPFEVQEQVDEVAK